MLLRGFFRPSLLVTLLFCVACSRKSPTELSIELEHALANDQQKNALIIAKNLLDVAEENNDEIAASRARAILGKNAFETGTYKIASRLLLSALSTNIQTTELWHLGIFASIESKNFDALKNLLQNENNPIAQEQLDSYKNWFTSNQKLPQKTDTKNDNSVNSAIFDLFTTYFSTRHSQNSIRHYKAYKRYLKNYPKQLEGNLYFGRYLYSIGHYSEANQYLSEYIQTRKKDTGTKALLAILAIKLGNYAAASEYIAAVEQSAPNSPVTYQVNALIALQNKDYQQALTQSELSLSSGGEDIAMRLVAAVSHYYLENYERANKHLVNIVDVLPQAHPANKLLIKVKLKLNQNEVAKQLLEEVTDKSEEDALLLRELQALYLQNGDKLKSQQTNAQLEKLANSSGQVKRALARAELFDSKPELEQAVANARYENQELFKLITMYLYENNSNAANQISKKWLEQQPNELDAINARAMVLVHSNRYDEASKMFERGLAVSPYNRPGVIYKFKTLRKEKRWQEIVDIASKLMNEDKLQADSFTFLLEGNLKLKQLSAENLAELLQGKSPYFESLALEFLFQRREYSLLNSFIKTAPRESWNHIKHVLVVCSTAYLKKNEEAVLEADKLLYTNPLLSQNQTTELVRALSLIKAFDRAERFLRLAIEKQILPPNANYMLAELLALQSKSSQLEHMLKQSSLSEIERINIELVINKLNNDTMSAWKTLIKLNNLVPSYDVLEQLKLLSSKLNKEDELKHIVLHTFDRMQNSKLARKKISTWFAVSDPDFTLTILKVNAMKPIIDQDFVLLNNLAWIHFQKGNNSLARTYADKALMIEPNNPLIMDTHRRVHQN